MDHWTENAIEPFFVMLTDTERTATMINTDNICRKESKIVPGEKGVYARRDIPKGGIVEWSVGACVRSCANRAGQGEFLYSPNVTNGFQRTIDPYLYI